MSQAAKYIATLDTCWQRIVFSEDKRFCSHEPENHQSYCHNFEEAPRSRTMYKRQSGRRGLIG